MEAGGPVRQQALEVDGGGNLAVVRRSSTHLLEEERADRWGPSARDEERAVRKNKICPSLCHVGLKYGTEYQKTC
jgi:hypothetical protein